MKAKKLIAAATAGTMLGLIGPSTAPVEKPKQGTYQVIKTGENKETTISQEEIARQAELARYAGPGVCSIDGINGKTVSIRVKGLPHVKGISMGTFVGPNGEGMGGETPIEDATVTKTANGQVISIPNPLGNATPGRTWEVGADLGTPEHPLVAQCGNIAIGAGQQYTILGPKV